MDNLEVTVDSSVLQEKAKEFAMKGALSAIESFYTGYDSPFKKAIMETLNKTTVDSHAFSLPDILASINDHLTAEIDKIANTAIAQTFVPLVTKFLTRQEKFADFTDILKEFIETAGYEDKSPGDFEVSVDKTSHGWLDISICDSKRDYRFTLHEDYNSKKESKIKYCLLSLPSTYKTEDLVMELSVGDAKLKLPFTHDILKDKFVSYLAGYIISDTVITMDTTDFDDSMFPESCHCH